MEIPTYNSVVGYELFSVGSIEVVKVVIRLEVAHYENLDFDTCSNILNDFST